MITSRSNEKIKNVRKLFTSAKERNKKGLFVVEGKKMFAEIPCGATEEIFVSESFYEDIKNAQELSDNDGQNILKGKKLEIVADDIFKSLSDTVTPQGIIALVKQPCYDSYDLIKEAKEDATFVLLDDIRDPGNLGTILRTCEAAGAEGIFLSEGCADIFSPKVIRSTMGSIFRKKFAICDLNHAIRLLKENGVRIVGTDIGAEMNHKNAPYGKSNAFIIGNEANGVEDELLLQTDFNVKIEMKGQVESLNAAISLAILLFR